jgi:hypothetical protein
MKKTVLVIATILIGASAFAGQLSIQKAAAKLKANDTRTVIKEVENTDGNPCLPDGKSFLVELQVKQAAFNRETNKVVYSWETVKTVSVDKDGGVTEVCAE